MKVLSRETTDPGTPFRARHSLRAQHTVASPKHTHPPGSAEHKPATKASHPNGRRDVPCQSTRANGSVSSKLGHPLPQMGKQGLPGAPFPLAARSQHPAVGGSAELGGRSKDRWGDTEKDFAAKRGPPLPRFVCPSTSSDALHWWLRKEPVHDLSRGVTVHYGTPPLLVPPSGKGRDSICAAWTRGIVAGLSRGANGRQRKLSPFCSLPQTSVFHLAAARLCLWRVL